MTKKEEIISLITENSKMTQTDLSLSIYGDKNHGPYLHDSLMSLLNQDYLVRTTEKPYLYSLGSVPYEEKNKKQNKDKNKRDVSKDIISNETLLEIEHEVETSESYGPENRLITSCLLKYPENKNIENIALKASLIDVTNSTNLSRYKQYINLEELATIISKIPNIDIRIKEGDPSVVTEIAKCNGKINLFSFASKYCCYHNRNLYKNDDYSIWDTVLQDYLPEYFPELTSTQLKRWNKNYDYKAYNNFITKKLNELNITIPFRRRIFDHFIWYKNR